MCLLQCWKEGALKASAENFMGMLKNSGGFKEES